MRLSATFPLLPGLSLPAVPALFGALSAAPAAVEAQREPVVVAAAVVSVQAPAAPASAQNFDDLDLDQRVRLIGEW